MTRPFPSGEVWVRQGSSRFVHFLRVHYFVCRRVTNLLPSIQYESYHIIYHIYCAQIEIHLSGCLNSPSWAAVQRQRAANVLLVLVAKKPLQSREPPDLSRPLSLDQGHIEIVPQLMVHVCPEVSNPKPQDHQLLEISH